MPVRDADPNTLLVRHSKARVIMDSQDDRLGNVTAVAPPMTDETSYGAAVENYLGKKYSAQRRVRLDSIHQRLQDEGSPVVIRNPGGPTMIAYFSATPPVNDDGFYIVDLADLPAPSLEALGTVFGLSSAEARLARFLAKGETLDAAARSLDIKPTTARSQLAAIFEKTGTRRQAKLVALLSRLAHIS